MAINYELINKGGISLSTNFELLSDKPLDARQSVPTLEGLQNLIDNGAAYEGMVVYVSDQKTHYKIQLTEENTVSYRELNLTEAELKSLIASETTGNFDNASEAIATETAERQAAIEAERAAREAAINKLYQNSEIDTKVEEINKLISVTEEELKNLIESEVTESFETTSKTIETLETDLTTAITTAESNAKTYTDGEIIEAFAKFLSQENRPEGTELPSTLAEILAEYATKKYVEDNRVEIKFSIEDDVLILD